MSELFDYNNDISKNAILNWRTERYDPINNMEVVAKGYMEGAKILVDECLADNSHNKADAIIFPVFFLLHQEIELYTKAICWLTNSLLGSKEKFKKTHDIDELWKIAKNNIEKYGFGIGREEKEFKNMIKGLEGYLEELRKKDYQIFKNMDFSRYPLTRKPMDHQFYVKDLNNVVVDLEVMKETITDISDCLNRLFWYYYNKLYENDEYE